jgi:hypothetical protein
MSNKLEVAIAAAKLTAASGHDHFLHLEPPMRGLTINICRFFASFLSNGKN